MIAIGDRVKFFCDGERMFDIDFVRDVVVVVVTAIELFDTLTRSRIDGSILNLIRRG